MMLSNGLATLCLAFLAGRQQQQQQQEDTPIVTTMFFPISGCSRRTAFVSYGYHQQQSFPSSAVTLHQQRQRDERVTRNNNPSFAINKKIVHLGKKKDWEGILKVYEEEKDQFNNVNYATMMSQLGRIHSFDKRDPVFLRFLDDLAEKIENRGFEWIGVREASNIIHALGRMRLSSNTGIIQWMSKLENAEKFFAKAEPQNISNVAWAFARVEFLPTDFFGEINKHAQCLVQKGGPQEVANTAWACATLGFAAPNLFAEIDRHAEEFVQKGKPQEVANTAWACATLDFHALNLFAEIGRHTEWLVNEGDPQNIANTAWACATLGFNAPNMFVEIDRRAEWLVKEAKPQEVSNTAWACATLGMNAPKLFAMIDRHAAWLVKEGAPQAIANTASACATLGINAPNLFAEIDRRAEWIVKEGAPQATAITAWACASLGINAPSLFAKIDHHAEWLVKEGAPQAVANTAWACAKLGFDAPNLFGEIDSHAEWLVDEGNSQDVANTAWAFATLGYDSSNLLSEVDARADHSLLKLTEQSIANTCFAIVVSDCTVKFKGLLVRLWDKVIQVHDNFNDIDLIQLSQVQLFALADGVKLPKPPDNLLIKMNLAMREIEENTVSRQQKEVSEALEELGLSWDLEVAPVPGMSLGGMLAIDVACKDKKIAVEFDGPLHFLKELGTGNISLKENGTTRSKRRFLEKLGWNVINIDYRDWKNVNCVGCEKQWLREKLIACMRNSGCTQTASVVEPIEEEKRWKRLDAELADGQAVRVSGGDYQGMFGVVVRRTKHKAVVLIEGSEKERVLAKRNVEGIEWLNKKN